MMQFKQPIADMYSMFFQKRKFAVSFFFLNTQVHTQENLNTDILEHLFLTRILICIEMRKTTQIRNAPFSNCTGKAKKKCYLLKLYI